MEPDDDDDDDDHDDDDDDDYDCDDLDDGADGYDNEEVLYLLAVDDERAVRLGWCHGVVQLDVVVLLVVGVLDRHHHDRLVHHEQDEKREQHVDRSSRFHLVRRFSFAYFLIWRIPKI